MAPADGTLQKGEVDTAEGPASCPWVIFLQAHLQDEVCFSPAAPCWSCGGYSASGASVSPSSEEQPHHSGGQHDAHSSPVSSILGISLCLPEINSTGVTMIL